MTQERFINLLLFPLPMTDILITNDDGYKSAGFVPLFKELSKEFSITAVVPDRGRSWIGKAITTKKELRLKKINYQGVDMFILNGTPADCVQIGLYDVVETRPKILISGINIGLNIGQARTLSSGTIGAAIEGSIDGVRGIASSLTIPLSVRDSKTDFYHPKSYNLFENEAKIIRQEISTKMTRDPELFLVYEMKGEVLGTVVGGWDGWRGWIYKLGVSEKCRRKGIGSALVKEVTQRLAKLGAKRIGTYAFSTKFNSATR
jgi:hypothetical protein